MKLQVAADRLVSPQAGGKIREVFIRMRGRAIEQVKVMRASVPQLRRTFRCRLPPEGLLLHTTRRKQGSSNASGFVRAIICPFARIKIPLVSLCQRAPVAQLDRVSPSEGESHRFESCRVRHHALKSLSVEPWRPVHEHATASSPELKWAYTGLAPSSAQFPALRAKAHLECGKSTGTLAIAPLPSSYCLCPQRLGAVGP